MKRLATLLLLSACSSDPVEPTSADSGVSFDGGTFSPASPEPPDLPTEPAAATLPHATCPEGWRMTERSGVVCHPWPESGRADCDEDEAHFPGTPSCARLGTACPAGDFADNLPSDRNAIYVLAGATGGNGSLAQPYDSIRGGVANAPSGTVIAVGKGTYNEVIDLPRDVWLWGACVSETILTSNSRDDQVGVVNPEGPLVEIHNLSIQNAARPGIMLVRGSARLLLEDAVIDGTTTIGIGAFRGARVTIRRTAIRNIRRRSGIFGRAIALQDHGGLEADRAVLHSSGDFTLFLAESGTSALLNRVVLAGENVGINVQEGAGLEADALVVTQGDEAGIKVLGTSTARLSHTFIRTGAERIGGVGLYCARGSNVELSGAWLFDNRDFGIFVDGADTALALTDAVVADTKSAQLSGIGLGVANESTATVTRASFLRNRTIGILASGSVRLEDVTVEDTQPHEADDTGGMGIYLDEGAEAHIDRAMLTRNRETGLSVVGAHAEIEDLVVEDTTPSPVGDGRGVNIVIGASATITRARVTRSHNVGVVVVESNAILSDLTVSDTIIGEQGEGRGIEIWNAEAQLTRAMISGNRGHGMALIDRSELSFEDVTVRGTMPSVDNMFGRGITVAPGAHLTGARLALLDNHDHGLLVGSSSSSALIEDLLVSGTKEQVSDGQFGRAMVAQDGATLSVTRAHISANREIAVLAIGGIMTLTDVVIEQTAERACAVDICSSSPLGHGIVAIDGGAITMERFILDHNVMCGIQVVDADLDLLDGHVRHSAIGACVQTEGYDVERLSQKVFYYDNGINLQATTLPLPSSAVVDL